MSTETTTQKLEQETLDELCELTCALHDSRSYLEEAAEKIDDATVAGEFHKIANERAPIEEKMKKCLEMGEEESGTDGTWLGSLRESWLAFRSAINGGDPTVVLIEAERAEDAIVAKYKEVLPKIAGNPMNDQFLADYEIVKAGHDRVRDLRDQKKNS